MMSVFIPRCSIDKRTLGLMAPSAAEEARALITTRVEGVPETEPRRVEGTDEAGEGEARRLAAPPVAPPADL